MDQTDCVLCDPFGCTCHFFSTNPIFLQQGISPPREFPDRNPLNQKMPLQECVQPPFSSPRQQSRRSPGFQCDPNFNQGNFENQNYFPNARVGLVEDFTTPQVKF